MNVRVRRTKMQHAGTSDAIFVVAAICAALISTALLAFALFTSNLPG
jgi:hypothetical protein